MAHGGLQGGRSRVAETRAEILGLITRLRASGHTRFTANLNGRSEAGNGVSGNGVTAHGKERARTNGHGALPRSKEGPTRSDALEPIRKANGQGAQGETSPTALMRMLDSVESRLTR